jgi:hypothetical protein
MPPNFIREHDRHEHISWCGRFHGHEDGLEEFKQLADSLTRVMAPILDPLLVICGWANALLVLHSAAWKHPTPLVRAEEAAWDGEPASSGESDRQRRASKGRKNRRAFPLHIRRWSLQNNLFVVARETIRQLINPRSALLIEESQTASQLLPPLDELFRVGVIATDSDSPDEETNSEVSVDRPVASELRPQWDRVKRKLWFGSILLRHFGKVAASTQMPILDEFQRTGWQQAIRCKFPESTTPDSQRLDAVRHLNASLLDQNQIHFYNDGSGAICWGTGPTSNRRQTRRGTKSQKPS